MYLISSSFPPAINTSNSQLKGNFDFGAKIYYDIPSGAQHFDKLTADQIQIMAFTCSLSSSFPYAGNISI
jgi:hypothetical protein